MPEKATNGGLVEPELTPTSLGELLRRAREARGLTLAQVEHETRIRRRYLVALEADDLPALPAPVFTRGLVRAYVGFLGVDQIEAAELLNKEEARAEAGGVHPSVAPWRVPAPESRVSFRALVFGLAIGLVGVAIAFGLPRYQALFVPATAVAQVRTVEATAAPTAAPPAVPSTTATPAPTVAPSATPPPTVTLSAEGRGTATAAAAIRGVTVEAKVSGRVWAQVESDGQVSFSGILMPGERKVWKAERRLSLYVGDGALVDVTENGRAIGPMGPRGEVVKQEWTAAR